MIYSLHGKLTHVEQNLAVIECGGVGYGCRTTANTLADISGKDEVKVLTFLSVKENAIELFAFSTSSELNCFKMLTGVNGVGPKAALSILSDLTPQSFALTVASGDSKRLTNAPGIGTKIAQRIVLELKDKIAKENVQLAEGINSGASMSNLVVSGNNASEAMAALMVLGFSSSDAAIALSDISADTPVGEMVKYALKKLAQT